MDEQSEQRTTHASDRVFVDVNDLGNTKFTDRECGKIWMEKQGDNSPNYCPGCGRELFSDE